MTEKKLNQNQEIAAKYMGDALCILASAGCGKTTVLVAHYLELLKQKKLKPSQIVVTTFSEKSAADIKEKFLKELESFSDKQLLDEFLQAPISTLHGLAGRILRDSSLLLGIEPNFQVLDENESAYLKTQALQTTLHRLLQNSSQELLILLKAYGWNKIENEIFRMLQNWPEWKNIFSSTLTSHSSEEDSYKAAFQNLFLEIFSNYEELKRERESFDFNDLEEKAIELLQNNPWVAKHYQKQWKAYLIDEFQDTSSRQDLLLSLLLKLNEENNSLPKVHLAIVGDPKQSIYGFRGAKNHIFEKYQELIKQQGGLIVTLSENYRSPAPILNFVNKLFEKVFLNYSALQGPRETSQAIEVLTSSEEIEKLKIDEKRRREAEVFAKRIAELLKEDAQAREIFLLFRSSSSIPIYLKAFRDIKLPVFIKSGESLLQRQEIQDLLHAMRVLLEPHHALSWIGLLRSPAFNLSDEDLLEYSLDHQQKADWSQIHPLAQKITHQNPKQNPTEFLEWWFDESQIISLYSADARLQSKAQNILQFYNLCFEWETKHQGKLKEFVDEMDLLIRENIKINALSDQLGSGNNITFMTIHQSKGLDLPIVFLPDLKASSQHSESKALICRSENKWGLKIPIQKEGLKKHVMASEAFEENLAKIYFQQEEEENRVLYVACTRSTKKLVLGFLPKAPEKLKENFPLNARHLLQDVCSGLNGIYWLSSDESKKDIIPIHQDFSPTRIESFPRFQQNNLLRFAVTQLETYLRSPQEYHERYVLNISAESSNPIEKFRKKSGFSAIEKGQIFHQALCTYAENPKTPNIIQNLTAKHYRSSKQDKEIKPLEDLFQQCIRTPALRDILHAEEGYSEIPFKLLLDSYVIQGAMDRLVRKGSEWCVVDYKTHNTTSAHLPPKQEFEFQLKTYCLAASKMLHKTVEKAQVYFVIPHKTHDYFFTEKDLDAHENFLRNLMQEINTFIYTSQVNKNYGLTSTTNTGLVGGTRTGNTRLS